MSDIPKKEDEDLRQEVEELRARVERYEAEQGDSSTILPTRGLTWINRAPHFIRLKRPEHWKDWRARKPTVQ